ncbi:MAG: Sensor protein QseC [Verrucomicrobiaceae bacterium]|nr:Sensor protein QseC [Verrucomicrobiaceae bacterium]
MLHEHNDHSLRRLLLQRLLWPLIPILLLGAIFSYGLAQHAAVNAFDSGLLDDARDLARQIQWRNNSFVFELPIAAADMLAINNEDRVVYSISTGDGQPIAGDKSLLTLVSLRPKNEYELYDIQLSGKLYRTVVLRQTLGGTELFVVVAQTVKGRQYLLREIFFSMLLLGGTLVIASIAVVVSGVRSGLKPVEILRNEIARRSTSDLQPLSETFVPIELRPIVHGINELLAKLAASFAGYRRFIADAAHQLRTPLAALGSQLEVNIAQPPANVAALLQQLLATTQRTSHLANQLLSLARLEHTDGSTIDSRPVDVLDLIQDVASDFVLRAARNNVELEFEIERLSVPGSALLLRELLSNLLDNAVRYAPANTVITVSLKRRNKEIELIVADTGPGASATDLLKLGMPFFQLASSVPGGCGLGLAIVREIAKIHLGEVIFESDTQSRGFIARVKLPLNS